MIKKLFGFLSLAIFFMIVVAGFSSLAYKQTRIEPMDAPALAMESVILN